jgi:hypothetical protein
MHTKVLELTNSGWLLWQNTVEERSGTSNPYCTPIPIGSFYILSCWNGCCLGYSTELGESFFFFTYQCLQVCMILCKIFNGYSAHRESGVYTVLLNYVTMFLEFWELLSFISHELKYFSMTCPSWSLLYPVPAHGYSFPSVSFSRRFWKWSFLLCMYLCTEIVVGTNVCLYIQIFCSCSVHGYNL